MKTINLMWHALFSCSLRFRQQLRFISSHMRNDRENVHKEWQAHKAFSATELVVKGSYGSRLATEQTKQGGNLLCCRKQQQCRPMCCQKIEKFTINCIAVCSRVEFAVFRQDILLNCKYKRTKLNSLAKLAKDLAGYLHECVCRVEYCTTALNGNKFKTASMGIWLSSTLKSEIHYINTFSIRQAFQLNYSIRVMRCFSLIKLKAVVDMQTVKLVVIAMA